MGYNKDRQGSFRAKGACTRVINKLVHGQWNPQGCARIAEPLRSLVICSVTVYLVITPVHTSVLDLLSMSVRVFSTGGGETRTWC